MQRMRLNKKRRKEKKTFDFDFKEIVSNLLRDYFFLSAR